MKFEAPSWIGVAAICASILVAIFNKWWDPIAAYVGYPFGVHRCVKQLGRKVLQLSSVKAEVEYWDASPSSEECKEWLKRVSDLVQRVEVLETSLNKHHLNYLKRCKIGIEAQDELKEAEALIVQSSAIKPKVKPSITRRGGRLTADVKPSTTRQGDGLLLEALVQPEELPVPDPLPGTESTFNRVINFIKDNRPGFEIMGVWGMGGVGKTTLINLVRDSRPLYRDYFVDVVLVQLGKGCTEVADLQKAIAISIGLEEMSNEISQADIIFRHLEKKNFLLLLDDLWKDFDLEKVGIPSFQSRGNLVQPYRRKVILTTRSKIVCSNMECSNENTIQMKCLNKTDAWNLFEKIVGKTTFNHAEIRQLAEEIAEECRGLPMALCTIGKLMTPKIDPREWRTTRDLLKKSKLHEMTDIHEDLFKRLQESYDNLRDDMKERFLLCSLWPENENISMQKLIRWWTGLGLLDGFSDASDSGYSIINDLVRKSMLEKGDTGPDSTEDSHVKMHNMIRMMAIWIVNEQGYKNKWLPKSSYRSALAQDKWHKVEKAWVSQEDTSRWCQWSSTVCFPRLNMLVGQHLFSLNLMTHYFQTITFLDLEGMRRGGFPLEICKLTNLQHLNLSATRIGVLPLDLNKLIYLKYLYIRNNMHLQTIPDGLILALKSLQGLDLFGIGASSLNVLKELANFAGDLHMLGFTVQTIADITKLGQLKRVCTQALCMYHFEDRSDLDIINLQFLFELKELRELAIVASSRSQKVLVAEGSPNYDQWLLPYLETFELNNLLKLEKVAWRNAGMNIRVVSIYKCDKLKDVTWVHQLKRLEHLTVTQCNEMEILIEPGELLQGVGMNETATISFPRLKKLKLEELPKLSMICKEPCEFEELSYIFVARCNEMKDIQNQKYMQSMIKIDCSQGWWNQNSSGRFIPNLAPTFYS